MAKNTRRVSLCGEYFSNTANCSYIQGDFLNLMVNKHLHLLLSVDTRPH